MSSRSVVAVVTLALVGSVVIAGAVAGASVTKGDPQPELKPFTLATHDDGGGGSVAILGNGTLLAAYSVKTADGRGGVNVCIFPRAGTACASSSKTIVPPAGATNDTAGVPQVFVADKTHVYLLAGTTNTGALLYTSTNGGVTFGAPVSLGGLSVATAAMAGDNIIFSPGNGSGGAAVSSVNVVTPTAPGAPAIPSSAEAEYIGDGSYKGGALVVNGAFNGKVLADYAPVGADFNKASSYEDVGSFANEDFLGISGGALLTQASTGSYPVRLRLFNGKTFGAAHVVPKAEGSGPSSYVVVQSPGGGVHVFTVLAKNGYALDEESTSTGAKWSGPEALSSAEASSTFDGGLDSIGSGIVLGTNPASQGASKATAYPVLVTQHVTFAVNHTSVKVGRKVVASGTTHPVKMGRKVTLEILKKGLWHSVATTKASASGHFSFTVKEKAVGKVVYRAVGADSKGYVQFGYSSARKVDVVKSKKK
jgi:hypothetical protein